MTSTRSSASPLPSRTGATPAINTYHCACTTLLLATTYSLDTLPRRRSPGLDEALILPLPPLPQPTSATDFSEYDSDDDAGVVLGTADAKDRLEKRRGEKGYSLLLSTFLVSKAMIVQRADGFEKRRLLRCARCRCTVGYQLDDLHYAGVGADTATAAAAAPATDEIGGISGTDRVVYLLAEALVSTEEMKTGETT